MNGLFSIFIFTGMLVASASAAVAWPELSGPAREFFDSVHAPREVAVPLGDSGPNAVNVTDAFYS